MSSQGRNASAVAGYTFNQLSIRDSSSWTASKRRRLLALEKPIPNNGSYPNDPFQVMGGNRRLEYMFGNFEMGGTNGPNAVCTTAAVHAYTFIVLPGSLSLVYVDGDANLFANNTVVISGATNPQNNGTFQVLGVSNSILTISIPGGVFEHNSNATITTAATPCTGVAFNGNGNPYTLEFHQ
jgi:hypothetical protein